MTRTRHAPPTWPAAAAHRTGAALLVVAAVAALVLGGCANPLRRAQPATGAVAAAAPSRAALDAAVRTLATGDFAARARAARTLIAAGEDALPPLGRAGELRVRSAGGVPTSATRPVLAAVLAALPAEGVQAALATPWPNVRRASATELGKRDRWGAIPRLIERLEDPAADVRAAAAAALRRLTNNFFGYRALARAADRRVASERWRTWWSLEGRTRARERDEGPQARAERRR